MAQLDKKMLMSVTRRCWARFISCGLLHRLRRVAALIAPSALGLSISLAPWTAAAQDLGLPMVQLLQSTPVPPGWVIDPSGNATIFRNYSSDPRSHHTVLYTPVPSGDLIRSTLLIANLASNDASAHIGVLLSSANSLCMLGLYANRSAELSCAIGEQITPHGRIDNILKLDGSDRIQLVEIGKDAAFFVNHKEVGRITDHPALGADHALAFSGPGDFAINTFSVAHMTAEQLSGPAPATSPEVSTPPSNTPQQKPQQTGAFRIPPAPPRAGWQDLPSALGVTLVNETVQEGEHTVPLNLPPLQGGARTTTLDVAIAPTRTGQQSLRAAAGLLLENVEQDQSCGLQITAAGDGLLLCYAADGRGLEVARQPGVALGEGPHRLTVIEKGDELVAVVNGTAIGTLKSHPVIGGELSLIAWDRGAFSFAPVAAEAQSRPMSTPPARLEPRPAGSLGDHLQGPLPLFNGDRTRADAAYLGVTKSILMHELGHALIGELGVPATGPEEDAVDIYAALHLADMVVQAGQQRALATEAASYASLLWYYLGRIEERQAGWQDEHTGGLKRFRNMFCVIYGADPRSFSPLAQAVGFEERTLARCEDEFLKQNRAWRAILAPYARLSPSMPEGRLPATALGAQVVVEFQPSRRQVGEFVRRSYQEDLTQVAQALAEAYALPRTLKVTFQDCDVMNAWYYPKEGSVTMCYDIIEHFVVMISDIELSTEGGYSAAELGQARAPQPTGAAPQIAGQIAQATEEFVDFGIPAGMQLFAPPFRGPTPVENPQARTITTPEVRAMIERVPEVLIFDIREGTGLQSLPGAWQFAGAGRDGSLTDSLQVRLGAAVSELVGSDKDRPIIVLGEGPEDRAAWNAALRIAQDGYATRWYRGGISAWRAAGLPLQALR